MRSYALRPSAIIPASGAGASTSEPGQLELELDDPIKPDIVEPNGETVHQLHSEAQTLEELNAILRKYHVVHAERVFRSVREEADRAQQVARANGVTAPHHHNFVTLVFPAGTDLSQVLAELRTLPVVVRVVQVPKALKASALPCPVLLGDSDQLYADPVTTLERQWYSFRCRANLAWPISTGSGVVVADVDWGYRLTHQDLAPRLELDRAYNSFDGTTNVTQGTDTEHGTGVLGHIGGSGVEMLGFAPGCAIWPLQGNGTSTTPLPGDPWANGIDWVRQQDSGGRRKVINVEIQTASYGNYEMRPALNAAIRTAIGAGIIVCIAAGNGNRDAGLDDEQQPIPETGSVLVGATAYYPQGNQRAYFSNYSKRVVVCAPGDPCHDVTCYIDSDNSYRNNTLGGTSGATPKISGTVALKLSDNPSLTQSDVVSILRACGCAALSDPAKPIGTFVDCAAAVAMAIGRRAEAAVG
jgi:subtilisin family serine protease